MASTFTIYTAHPRGKHFPFPQCLPRCWVSYSFIVLTEVINTFPPMVFLRWKVLLFMQCSPKWQALLLFIVLIHYAPCGKKHCASSKVLTEGRSIVLHASAHLRGENFCFCLPWCLSRWWVLYFPSYLLRWRALLFLQYFLFLFF